MSGRLDGKVAIVTGAGSRGPGLGNGKATAILFAREGALVLCVDLVKDRAEETAALLSAEGAETAALAADVTRAEDCGAMVAEAVNRWGGLDVRPGNVMQDASGQLKLIDPYFVAGKDLIQALLTDAPAVVRGYSVAELQGFLEIAAFEDERDAPGPVLAQLRERVDSIVRRGEGGAEPPG